MDRSRLIKELDALGYRFKRHATHGDLWVHPEYGATVSVTRTASDSHSHANALARARRLVATTCSQPGPIVVPAHQPQEEPMTAYNPVTEKRCQRCGVVKPVEAFRLDVRTQRRWDSCGACVGAAAAATRRAEKAGAPRPVPAPLVRTEEDAERMALRILASRHKEEYDAILLEAMIGLGL